MELKPIDEAQTEAEKFFEREDVQRASSVKTKKG